MITITPKLPPIAYKNVVPNRGRIIVQINVLDRENSLFKNGIWLAPKVSEGEYQVEESTVLAVSEEIKWLKPDDKIIMSYHISYDQRGKAKENEEMGRVQRNNHFIDIDDFGNEIRWCLADDVYGIITKDKIIPMKGWAFIEEVKTEPEKIVNGIIHLEKKVDTDKKGYTTKILAMNEADIKENIFKPNDIIFAKAQSDFKFKAMGKIIFAVPIQHIFGKINYE